MDELTPTELNDALTDIAMDVSNAIRAFPFWDFGMDDVDPNDEAAEWVFELAVKVTETVLNVLHISLEEAARMNNDG